MLHVWPPMTHLIMQRSGCHNTFAKQCCNDVTEIRLTHHAYHDFTSIPTWYPEVLLLYRLETKAKGFASRVCTGFLSQPSTYMHKIRLTWNRTSCEFKKCAACQLHWCCSYVSGLKGKVCGTSRCKASGCCCKYSLQWYAIQGAAVGSVSAGHHCCLCQTSSWYTCCLALQ